MQYVNCNKYFVFDIPPVLIDTSNSALLLLYTSADLGGYISDYFWFGILHFLLNRQGISIFTFFRFLFFMLKSITPIIHSVFSCWTRSKHLVTVFLCVLWILCYHPLLSKSNYSLNHLSTLRLSHGEFSVVLINIQLFTETHLIVVNIATIVISVTTSINALYFFLGFRD